MFSIYDLQADDFLNDIINICINTLYEPITFNNILLVDYRFRF